MPLDEPSQLPRLKAHRVHEVEGPGTMSFATYQLWQHAGPLFWISARLAGVAPAPFVLLPAVNERLHYVEAGSNDEVLWAAEETLRSKTVGFVVATPEKPLSLTAARRLQLAAEAGGTTGLMVIREGQGSNASETRWTSRPLSGDAERSQHLWELVKNKSGLVGSWVVEWNGNPEEFRVID